MTDVQDPTTDDPVAVPDPMLSEARASVALDGDTHSFDLPTIEPEQTPPAQAHQSAPALELTPQEIVRRIGLPITETEGGYQCPVCPSVLGYREAFGPHLRVHWREAGVDTDDVPRGADRIRCPQCDAPFKRTSLPSHLVNRHGIEQWTANGISRIVGFPVDLYFRDGARALDPDAARRAKDAERKRNQRGGASYGERAKEFVVCPTAECGAVQRRKNMPVHLEKVHHVDHDEARAIVNALRKSRHTSPVKSKLDYPGAKSTGRPPKASVPATTTTPTPAVTSPPMHGTEPRVDWTTIAPSELAIGIVQSQVNGSFPTALLPDVVSYVDHTRELVAKLRATSRS